MNRTTMLSRIQTRMQLNPGVITADERKEYIDNAIDELSAHGVWLASVQFTVSAQGSPISPPSPFHYPIQAFWDGKRLELVDGRSYQVATVPVSTPTRYYVAPDPTSTTFALKVYLWPNNSAQGTFKLDYISKGVSPLPVGSDSADLATYGIPADWHPVIILHAVMQAHDKNGDVLSSQRFERLVDRAVARMVLKATEGLNALTRQEEFELQDGVPMSKDTFIDPWS